jgi:hypothetical protein
MKTFFNLLRVAFPLIHSELLNNASSLVTNYLSLLLNLQIGSFLSCVKLSGYLTIASTTLRTAARGMMNIYL